VILSGCEDTDEGISVVQEHARSLNISFSVTIDRQVLTILGGGYCLTIKSL
jgi:hypothetical protein